MKLRARSSLSERNYKALMPTSTRLVVVDLETTGLSPASDFIIEIGALELVGLETQRAFRHLACPPKALSEGISRLTGLQPHDLRDQPPPSSAVTAFLDWLGEDDDMTLVGHNLAFDLSFLAAEVDRINRSNSRCLCLPTHSFCTYQFIRTAFFGRTLDLERACRLLAVKVEKGTQRHRAVADCALTHRLLHSLWHWDYFLDSPTLQVVSAHADPPPQSTVRKLPWLA